MSAIVNGTLKVLVFNLGQVIMQNDARRQSDVDICKLSLDVYTRLKEFILSC